MLDRHRPLFRCWLIDGVPGGRFAIYTKTHHSIIDGVSGLRKLYEGLTLSDEPAIPSPPFALPLPEPEARTPPPALRRLTDALHGAVAQVGALNQNVAAAVIDHGLHAYLREVGQAYGHEFIAMCPVSLRDDSDSATGTRVSAIFVRLGEPEVSIVERLRQVVHSVSTAKKEIGAMSADAAMTYSVVLVALAGAGATTHLERVGHPACNLVISNVPGAREPRYLNGAQLTGIFPVSALAASIGLNVTFSSYCDHMDFGFVANAAAIGDVRGLAQHTRRAYADLKAQTRQPSHHR